MRHCPAPAVRFDMAREVVVAFVATNEVENKLVDVALVRMADVAPRDVEVALVNERFVPEIAVVEAYGKVLATILVEVKVPEVLKLPTELTLPVFDMEKSVEVAQLAVDEAR